MYNLVPAVGEINGLRSNYSFGIIPGEKREFGSCLSSTQDLDDGGSTIMVLGSCMRSSGFLLYFSFLQPRNQPIEFLSGYSRLPAL